MMILWDLYGVYPLVMTNIAAIAMENGTIFYGKIHYNFLMVIFHSYVCLPEGNVGVLLKVMWL